MHAITKSARINTALKVVQHINNGMTVVNACQEVGMPRSSYYYILEHNPEYFAEVQDLVRENEMQGLALILATQIETLEKVIDDALAETTRPRDRLAIFNKLNDLQEKLSHKILAEQKSSEDVSKLLTGPKLKPGKSRF